MDTWDWDVVRTGLFLAAAGTLLLIFLRLLAHRDWDVSRRLGILLLGWSVIVLWCIKDYLTSPIHQILWQHRLRPVYAWLIVGCSFVFNCQIWSGLIAEPIETIGRGLAAIELAGFTIPVAFVSIVVAFLSARALRGRYYLRARSFNKFLDDIIVTLGLLVGAVVAIGLIAASATASLTAPSVQPPPVAPTRAAPTETSRPPLMESSTRTVVVQASLDWQDSGITVSIGQVLVFTSTGTWTHGRSDPVSPNPYGPNGTNKREPLALLPGAPVGALIGRIGSAEPFLIGERATITARQAGRLQLSMNEHPGLFEGNEGSVQVTVQVK